MTPTNIENEKIKFIESQGSYVPKFEYHTPNIDIEKLSKQLHAIEIPDIPLSGLFARKKQEIHNKIQFVSSFLEQNTSDMTQYSQAIF